jgi:hypothetical protein
MILIDPTGNTVCYDPLHVSYSRLLKKGEDVIASLPEPALSAAKGSLAMTPVSFFFNTLIEMDWIIYIL